MTAPITPNEQACVGPIELKPHPDGKSWDKCCKGPGDGQMGCQCFMRSAAGESRFDRYIENGISLITDLIAEKGRFFCVHRSTDDGFHRECAGWAAKITGNRP